MRFPAYKAADMPRPETREGLIAMRLSHYLGFVNAAAIVLFVILSLFATMEYSYRFIEFRARARLVREAASISQQVTEFLGGVSLPAFALGNILVLAEPDSFVRILLRDDRDQLRTAATSVRATSALPCNLLEPAYQALLRTRTRQVMDGHPARAADRPESYTFKGEFCYSRPTADAPANGAEPVGTAFTCADCRAETVWIALLPIRAPDRLDLRGRQTTPPQVIGFVEVIQSREFLWEVRQRLWSTFLGASLVCFLVVSGATFAIARFFTAPLTQITQSIKNIQSAADATTPVQVDKMRGIQEVADLAAAFQGMQKRLGLILQSKQQLASNLSHELRNALGALELDIATLGRRSRNQAADPLADEIREDMRHNVAELIEMSDRSLNALFAETEEIKLKREIVALTPLLLETLAAVQAAARQKQVALLRGPMADVNIEVDRVYFKNDVMREMLVNAIDYAAPDGEVEVGAERADRTVRIWIRDTGPGIAPEHHEAIFEPYFRVDQAFHPGWNNRGLGLSLARNMVRRHGGDIRLRSALQEGSTFSIELPLPA